MKSLVKAFAMVVALAVVAGSAAAQTGTGQTQFGSVSGSLGTATASYGTTADGNQGTWYIGPYSGSMYLASGNTGLLLQPVFQMGAWGATTDIFCVDFADHLLTYDANFSNLTDAASITAYTRTGDASTYKKAAWLASQIKSHVSQRAAINGAIWNVMGWPLQWVDGNNSAIASWVTLANAKYNQIDSKYWTVISDKNGYVERSGNSVGQEFIVHVTPEPATLLLLGTGLVATMLVAAAFRRSA